MKTHTQYGGLGFNHPGHGQEEDEVVKEGGAGSSCRALLRHYSKGQKAKVGGGIYEKKAIGKTQRLPNEDKKIIERG